ncbi:hypothetical protein [Acinetobacter radioresistens]|uniref:hypothetical protein n=1 Tax=Acinetobacter radioresistens TaxID=40216 RepID=UPI000DAB6D4A|nr:hypothetical protein [Acinetobacter radioresistens]AWV86218.1 hypothetical protein DOM24_06350 [Acinetobacter radioresistens]MCX0327642.1 hypothetical protein [Acinetobacter radioresistens]
MHMRILVTLFIFLGILFLFLPSRASQNDGLEGAVIAAFYPRNKRSFKNFKFARIDHKKRLVVKEV